jgi:hypothetical protein
MYMQDCIAAYGFNGKTYLLTANEGDGREYSYDVHSSGCALAGHTDLGDGECLAYSDEIALQDLSLDASVLTADNMADFNMTLAGVI